MTDRKRQPGDGVDGFGVSAESSDGSVRFARDGRTGEITVRIRRGALRGRSEHEVAERIRSALVAASRAYTTQHREQMRRTQGDLPAELVAWGQR
ncbi:hypothetical protein [Krasilnikovia sp. MM14-A1259]|uniref:hypothetical protein n=1 Tax=Krasilnikovia sp. MM14-A1259 TaxID=3373539 RepID=UPI00399C7130